tara:strand:- start:7821 stop:9314 length:1494 start_codon:yes stop_codon:yes gene_type:complete
MKTIFKDVLVIGGGPSGSTVGALLSKNGINTLIVEKEKFPRFKVGESLLPSALKIFDFLGVREKIEKHGFVKKRGAYLRWGTDPEPWAITFGELIGDDGYSYHVIRSEFDELLLNNAREKGTEVWESTRFISIDLKPEKGRRKSAIVEREDGERIIVEFDQIVDCSGQSGVLGNRHLKLRRYHRAFKNVALWSYWKGAGRLPAPYEGSVLTSAIDNGWIWGIPLHDGSQSVGVVMHQEEFKELSSRMTPDEIYEKSLAKCPITKDLISPSRERSKLLVVKDYSYTSESLAGNGYFLCGDAACFLDPVLSSGVHLAMYSGMMAAASISAIYRNQVSEDQAITFYESVYRRAFTRFAQFLSAFYNQNHSTDNYFWEAQRITSQDVDSENMKRAFLGLVSGTTDLDEIDNAQLVETTLLEKVRENLDLRRKGVNIGNTSGVKRTEIEKNNHLFSLIEGITGLDENGQSEGLYATIFPTLGLRRAQCAAFKSSTKKGVVHA